MVMSDVKEEEVENFQKGRGHFQSKICVADFGSLSMKLIQESFQGMFFQQLY